MTINTNNLGMQSFANSGLPFNAGTLAIKARRAPTANDKNFPYGQVWVDLTDSTPYMLTLVSNGAATWTDISGGAGATGIETINAISPDGSGNIDLTSTNSSVTLTPATHAIDLSVLFPITEFIVGTGGKAQYTTVQDGLDAANTAGGGIVYVQPGTYTEALTLYDNVAIVGASPESTTIIGIHTPPDTGLLAFSDINLKVTGSDSIIYSLSAGTGSFVFRDCTFDVNEGVILALHNWLTPGSASFYSCRSITTQYDGWIENSEGNMDVFAIDSVLGANGNVSTAFINGYCQLRNCTIGCDVTYGGPVVLDFCEFQGIQTLNGASSGNVTNCYLTPGQFESYAASIETDNTINISNCVVNTPASPAIECPSSGTINITNVSFQQNNAQTFDFDVATTVTWGSTETGELTTTHLHMPVTAGAAVAGNATLSSGTVVVNTTAVTANSLIYLSYATVGGIGILSAAKADIVAGTSFTINSSDATDSTSKVNWLIIN